MLSHASGAANQGPTSTVPGSREVVTIRRTIVLPRRPQPDCDGPSTGLPPTFSLPLITVRKSAMPCSQGEAHNSSLRLANWTGITFPRPCQER
jgi:hypothetical protein